jgi:hypothetical protein
LFLIEALPADPASNCEENEHRGEQSNERNYRPRPTSHDQGTNDMTDPYQHK